MYCHDSRNRMDSILGGRLRKPVCVGGGGIDFLLPRGAGGSEPVSVRASRVTMRTRALSDLTYASFRVCLPRLALCSLFP